MKKIAKWTQLKLPRIIKKTLMFVSFLLVFDVLLATFAATYPSEAPVSLFSKSALVTMSNLVFLEGAIIFSIGAFLEFAQSFRDARPSGKPLNEQTLDRKKLREQLLRPGIFIMILGAGFIGLAIVLGTLLF